MIHINKDETNQVVMTLTELMIDSNNWVYLLFTNETTNQTTDILLSMNLSPSRGRYDLFEIVEKENAIAENQEVYFNATGFWKYDAYEVSPDSPLDLENLTLIKKLETGRCNVAGEMSEIDEVYR